MGSLRDGKIEHMKDESRNEWEEAIFDR